MRDIIDERNEKERISRSIVKYWNVNYIANPVDEKAQEVVNRLADEAAMDEAAKQREIEEAMEAARRLEELDSLYNKETGSYSGTYGLQEVEDEVTKGQIDKILQEKNAALRELIEHSDDYH